MKRLSRLWVVLLVVGAAAGVFAIRAGAFQRFPGGFYRGVTPTPGDAKHEFAWSRLQYTPISRGYGGYGYRYGGGFGGWGGTWARDYPKADITFLAALRRLTRIDARSYQQVVNLDNDDIFNY